VEFTREPVLAIWQAMKPLAEVQLRPDAPDISRMLAEAEAVLFGIVLALVRRAKNGESISSSGASIPMRGTSQ
jgi:hypothetical protein